MNNLVLEALTVVRRLMNPVIALQTTLITASHGPNFNPFTAEFKHLNYVPYTKVLSLAIILYDPRIVVKLCCQETDYNGMNKTITQCTTRESGGS